MKQFKILAIAVLMGFVACEKGGEQGSASGNDVDIQFIKQGEVYLSNEGTLVKTVDVEFAENDNTRRIGLMNRSEMEENQGMLFIFEKDNNTSFWMKNTRIPLSIMFFDKDSTLINYHDNAQPFETDIKYGADSTYRFVLEANGGSASKWGLKPGITKLSYKKN